MKSANAFPLLAAVVLAWGAGLPPAAAAEYDITVIADKSTPVPDGSGNFTFFGSPSLDGGNVAFQGWDSAGHSGIYVDMGGLGVVADENTAIPGGSGNFSGLSSPSADGGNLAFKGVGSGGQQGIYTDMGGLGVVADTSTAIPGGAGNFTGLSSPSLGGGHVAFKGVGSGGHQGIYNDIGGLGLVADTGTAIPGGSGNFTGLYVPSLDGGQVAFKGVGSGSQEGIYTDIGGLGLVADTGTPVPGGGAGNFTQFYDPSLDGGNVAFTGCDAVGQSGIYTDIGGLAVVADETTSVPGGSGQFAGLYTPSLQGGHVAFGGYDAAGQEGIYTDVDGLSLVADTGTAIPGGSGQFTCLNDPSLDGGNVAFQGAGSGQQGIYVAFSAHQWDSCASGAWDAPGNWLFDTLPRRVVPTFISPKNGLIVTGPAGPATIRSLTLGAQTAGVATLELQPSGTLTVDEQVAITARGKLTGDGVLQATGGIDNAGEIDLAASSLQISGGPLLNRGLVCGSGAVDNVLANTADGEVRVESGRRLVFTAPANSNAGEVKLLGGIVEFKEDLTNTSTGFISGRGALDVAGGLTNQGVLALSGGFTDLYGDVTNEAAGQVVVSGGSTTTFYDDVASDGKIRVSEACSAVFFGAFTGTGGTTGSGTVYLEGDLRPGHSPAAVGFGGDVVFGPAAALETELAGTAPGEYDAVHVAGAATLAGTLAVECVDPYRPAHNDAFQVMTFASRGGTTFDAHQGLDLGGRLTLVPTYGETDLVLAAVQGGPGQWAVDADGDASVPTNWSAGLPNGTGDVATFGPVITAGREVTVDEPTVLGGIVFDSAEAYTLAGPHALTFDAETGAAAIGVADEAATHTVGADMALADALDVDVAALGTLVFGAGGLLDNSAGRTITKTGPGTLVIGGQQEHGTDALLEILAGTVAMNTDASGTEDMTGANLSILVAGAQLDFGHDQHLDTLEIAGDGLVRFTGADVVMVKNLVMDGVPLGPTTLTPEPATLALLAAGAAAMGLKRRRRGGRHR